MYKDNQPKAIIQYNIISYVRLLYFIIFCAFVAYNYWCIFAVREPLLDIKYVNIVIVICCITELCISLIFKFIIPIENPMFLAIAYVNLFNRNDLSLLETAKICRSKIFKFIKFDFLFDVNFIINKYRVESQAEMYNIIFNADLLYNLRLFNFLLVNSNDETFIKEKMEAIVKNSDLLFRIAKLKTTIFLKVIDFIFISIVFTLILFSLGILNAFLFIPFLLILYLIILPFFTTKRYFDYLGKNAIFYYGIFSNPDALVYLKNSITDKTIITRMKSSVILLLASFFLMPIIRSYYASDSIWMTLSLILFILAFGNFFKQIQSKQIYYKFASLDPNIKLSESQSIQELDKAKNQLKIGASASNKLQSSLNTIIFFWVLASLPVMNIIMTIPLVCMLINLKFQKDLAYLLNRDNFFSTLVILALLTWIPFLGSVFGIIGIIKCRKIINFYKTKVE